MSAIVENQLPLELIEEILDLLAVEAQRSALKNCSLVCRAWVPRCRAHIFASCRLVPKNIRVFSEFLRAPNDCTFLSHIRAIEASRYQWTDQDRCFNSIAEDLRRLNVLSLRMKINIIVDDSNPFNSDMFFRTGFVTGFPHVTLLVLDSNCFNATPAPLVDMICMFPALQDLRILTMSEYMPVEPRGEVTPPCGLRQVGLCRNSVNPILSWLHEYKHLPSIHSLTLPLLHRREAPAVRNSLKQAGDALHHLDLEITWVLEHSDVDPLETFDLSLHPNLRTLTIRDHSWAEPEDFDGINLLPLLSKLATPALETVSVGFDLTLYRDLEWSQLDAFFDRAQFPCLVDVTLEADAGDDADFLRKSLPMLCASGLLRVVEKIPERFR